MGRLILLRFMRVALIFAVNIFPLKLVLHDFEYIRLISHSICTIFIQGMLVLAFGLSPKGTKYL